MDFSNITFDLPKDKSAAIKVIGVGGGGSNAVNYMFQQGITGVDFVVCNTDAQALQTSPIPNKIQLGASITEGLGAGANPEVGEQAALESLDDIKALLDTNTKMVFITAGMGGGTGTGAAPIIANVAKELGILTVGIVTAPFYFEGKMRLEQAKLGIEKLRNNVDSLIIINNDKLRELYGNLGYKTGFAKADEVLSTAAKGIAEVITHHYATNIDLRDAKTVLADSGTAIMGSAKANGDTKARKAIELALDSPLLNDNKITGARNVLLLIVSGNDEVTMDEIGLINDYIQQEAGNNANIIMGIGEDSELGDNISITVIATGFPVEQQNYTGKEEQQVVHRLEEDQPLTKRLSLEKPMQKKPSILKKEEPKKFELKEEAEPEEEIKINPQNELPNTKKTEYSLFEIEEEIVDEIEEDFVEDVLEESHEEIEFEFDLIEDELVEEVEETVEEEEIDEILTEPIQKKENLIEEKIEKEEEITFFTLDEDWEEELEKPTATTPKETKTQPEAKKTEIIEEVKVKVEETPQTPKKPLKRIVDGEDENPLDSPISDVLSKQINDRKERLKKFNFKFKQSLTDKETHDVPAYKRNNVDLSEHKHSKPSKYNVQEADDNEIKIRPNHFLNDNVD